MKKIFEILNRSKGQAMVEYAILFLIVVIAIGGYKYAEEKTQTAMVGSLQYATGENLPLTKIKSPNKVSIDDIASPYEKEVLKEIESYKEDGTPIYKNHPPVAFFNVPEKLFAGQEFKVQNFSYDVDGKIVKSIFSGAFSKSGGSTLEHTLKIDSPGTYTITLYVEDDRGATDTYSVTFVVEARGTYTQIEMDHKAASRRDVATQLTNPVTSKRITEHLYGVSKDKFDYYHLVIGKNFWETTTEQNEVTMYEWTIPYILVTYSGDGQRLGAVPYMENGVQKVHIKKDTQETPIPTDPVKEWKTNQWSYYVYDKFSSTRPGDGYTFLKYDPVNGHLHNGKRLEAKKTTQNPELTQVRETLIIDNYQHPDHNEGWKASSATCKTCTLPNVVTRYTESNNSKTLVSGTMQCMGKYSSSRPVLTRTYHYMTHESFDVYYRHSGSDIKLSGGVANTETDGDVELRTTIAGGTNLKRGSTWRTEGQPKEQQYGNTGITDLDKYENCGVNGYGNDGSDSEHCWKTNDGDFYVTLDKEVQTGETWEQKGSCTTPTKNKPSVCTYYWGYKLYYEKYYCPYTISVSNSNWKANVSPSFSSYVFARNGSQQGSYTK